MTIIKFNSLTNKLTEYTFGTFLNRVQLSLIFPFFKEGNTGMIVIRL